MEQEFFTWAGLATYAGALGMTVALTQFFKRLWPANWPTQYLSAIIAVVLLVLVEVFKGVASPDSIIIAVLNAIILGQAANGAYENFISKKE